MIREVVLVVVVVVLAVELVLAVVVDLGMSHQYNYCTLLYFL